VKKILIEGQVGGEGGKLASGEKANNRKKAHEVYCPQDY